uniref:Acyl-CoA dehydrogenase family member 11-like n=1 Tax=Sinocyclocheilus grahami TaxID=75366 RepID=A0A672NWY5_SINGR
CSLYHGVRLFSLIFLNRSVSHSSVSISEPDSHTHTPAPFSRSSIGTFFQERPLLTNPFTQDALLRAYLQRHLPDQQVQRDLLLFGERLVSEIEALGRQCELSPPVLQRYDAWGRRVDRILTCDAWTRLKHISAQEGLVAAGYERTYGDWSRVYQMSKIYLFAPSAGLYTCPLAMTDGAAKVIESLGVPVREAFERLTTRDEKRFWTSGQWMTERRGGSDVSSGTETVARRQQDGWFKLYGFKWFTSATDADVTLTLARITDRHGRSTAGSSGLSLFLAEVWDSDGLCNGIEVQRLKDKLGTRQVPTAELLLDGMSAQLLSEEGRGVASIANMLTITRIHNTVCAVGAMRRITHLCREYARKRAAFGKLLKDHALHVQTLSRLEVETRAAFLFAMEVCRLLGREENRSASDRDTLLLRLHTHTDSHKHTHSLTHSLSHTLTLSYTHTHTLTLTHSHTLTLSQTHSLTHSHSHSHTHTHTLSHTNTLTLSHTHTHTHTLTNTLTHTHSLTQTLSLSHSYTHTLSHTHSLTHTLSHSLTHT